jgi:hypothetical protein
MKPALHIFLKDLRKFWPVILATVAVRVLGDYVALSHLDSLRALGDLGPALTKVFQQAPLIQWLMVFLLSVWVVQEDRAVGDRIAWLTRPIFARDLVVAKFLFLVVGVALPAGLVSAAMAAYLHSSSATLLAAAATATFLTFIFAGMCAAVAVICATLNQALILTAGIFVGLFAVTYLVFEVGLVRGVADSSPISAGSRLLAAVGLMGSSAVATVGYQYRMRRRRPALALGLILFIAAFFGVHRWPVDLWRNAMDWSAAKPTPQAALALEPAQSPADFRTSERPFQPSEASVLVPLRLHGLAPDRLFTVRRLSSTFASAAGPVVSTHRYGYTSFNHPDGGAVALGFAPSDQPSVSNVEAIKLGLDEFRRLQGKTGRLTAELELGEMRFEPRLQLPLRVGAESIADGHLARIVTTRFINASYEVGFQYAQVDPLLGERREIGPDRFVLVNRSRGEYAEAHGGSVSGTGGPEMDFRTSRMRFDETRSANTGSVAGRIDADWLRGAEFDYVVAKPIHADPITLSFTIDPFTIPTKQVTWHVIIVKPDGTRVEKDQ